MFQLMWLLDARVRGNQRFTNNAVGPGDHEEEMGSRIGVRRNNRGQTTIINNQPKILSTEEKKAVAYNLSRFVRNS